MVRSGITRVYKQFREFVDTFPELGDYAVEHHAKMETLVERAVPLRDQNQFLDKAIIRTFDSNFYQEEEIDEEMREVDHYADLIGEVLNSGRLVKQSHDTVVQMSLNASLPTGAVVNSMSASSPLTSTPFFGSGSGGPDKFVGIKPPNVNSQCFRETASFGLPSLTALWV